MFGFSRTGGTARYGMILTLPLMLHPVASGGSAYCQLTYRTIAVTGDAAPGAATGQVYERFFQPALNAAGRTAFAATLSGPGVSSENDMGIWSDGSGAPLLIARTGAAAPDTPAGVVYDSFAVPNLNDAGQTAFWAGVRGTSVTTSNDAGIWSEGMGQLGLVAREGDQAPGLSAGTKFESFYRFPILNDTSQTGVLATLAGTGINNSNNRASWISGGGALRLVARKGSAAPGTGAGIVFGEITFTSLNDNGQTAFYGVLDGPGIDSTNDDGIWAGGTEGLALVVRAGDEAPGMASGVVFRETGLPRSNNAGDLVFRAFLEGPGVTGANEAGIWSNRGGSLELVARAGEHAPGTPDGVVYVDFSGEISSAGHIAIWAFVTGPGVDSSNHLGIWSDSTGDWRLVARKGDAAPGTAAGAVFDSINGPTTNCAGQIAFSAGLSGADIDASNDAGIWVTTRAGELQLVAREGDLFDINDDPLVEEMRTISSLSLHLASSGEDGLRRSFNDGGQLAFAATFTDGSEGVFIAHIAIPEPDMMVLGCLSLVLMLAQRVRWIAG